jgi:hypothetical protein
MVFKGSSNINMLSARIYNDLANKKKRVAADNIGSYLVGQIKAEAKSALSEMPKTDDLRDGELPQDKKDLIDKISYKVDIDLMGRPTLKVGIFGDEPAARAMEQIEYGDVRNMEKPIFRKTLYAEESTVTKSIKVSGGNNL